MTEALEIFLQERHLEDCIIWLCTVALYREPISTQIPLLTSLCLTEPKNKYAEAPGPSIGEQLKLEPFSAVIKSKSLIYGNLTSLLPVRMNICFYRIMNWGCAAGMLAIHTCSDLYKRLWW